jgi:hypothetical protein
MLQITRHAISYNKISVFPCILLQNGVIHGQGRLLLSVYWNVCRFLFCFLESKLKSDLLAVAGTSGGDFRMHYLFGGRFATAGKNTADSANSTDFAIKFCWHCLKEAV